MDPIALEKVLEIYPDVKAVVVHIYTVRRARLMKSEQFVINMALLLWRTQQSHLALHIKVGRLAALGITALSASMRTKS